MNPRWGERKGIGMFSAGASATGIWPTSPSLGPRNAQPPPPAPRTLPVKAPARGDGLLSSWRRDPERQSAPVAPRTRHEPPRSSEITLPESCFVSATGGGALSGSTVVWNLGNIYAGPSGSLQATVTFTADGTYSFQRNGSWIAGQTPRATTSNTVTTIRDTVPPLSRS